MGSRHQNAPEEAAWQGLQWSCSGLQMLTWFSQASCQTALPFSSVPTFFSLALGLRYRKWSESSCLPKDSSSPLGVCGKTGLGTPKRSVFCFTPTLDLARTAEKWIYYSHTKQPHTQLFLPRHLLLPLKNYLVRQSCLITWFSIWFASETMTHLKTSLLKRQGQEESFTWLGRGETLCGQLADSFPPFTCKSRVRL